MTADLVAVVLVSEVDGDGVVLQVTRYGSLCACRGCLDRWGVPPDAGVYRLAWRWDATRPVVERLPAWPEP